jgi:ABC-type branched-subunit amino acid transport system ATPase component
MLALGRALAGRPRLLMLDSLVGSAAVVRSCRDRRLRRRLTVPSSSRMCEDAPRSRRAYPEVEGAVEGTSDELARHEGVRKSYLGY